MNKKVKLTLIIIILAILFAALLLGVYYWQSYNSIDNETADEINKGNAFMESACYEEAIECYEKALENEQGNEKIISAIVEAYMLKGQEDTASDTELAIDDYNKAISYNSNNKSAYWAIADIYESNGDEDSMLNILDQGYNDTGDAAMDSKSASIKEKRAEEEAKEEEAARLQEEMEKEQEENQKMLEPLLPLFEAEDYDGLKDLLRSDEYVAFSEAVIGDTSYYLGDTSDSGQREGKGLAVYENGYYYYGDFSNDQRSGEGVYFRASYSESSSIGSSLYKGEWSNDKPNGHGIATSNYYKDRISSTDFVTKSIEGDYSDGLENGKMTLTGTTKDGSKKTYTYTAENGVAKQSSNEDSGVKGQYIIAQTDNDKLTSDGSVRGVDGFTEEE